MRKFLLFLMLCSTPAFATTFYVDAGTPGDDAHNCTQAQTIGTAKKTIGAALGCASGGDTVEVRAGSYHESVYLTVPSGTDNTHRTTIKKHTGDATPVMFGTLTLALEDNITWDGITINDVGDGNDIDDCVFINSGSNITITNSELVNCQRHGVLTGDGNGAPLSNLLFSYLTVHNTGQGFMTSVDPRHHNFYIAASHYTTGPIVIDHVESYNTGNAANAGSGGPSGSAANSWGIQVYAAVPGYLDGVVVSNNYVHDNNQGIVVGSGANHKVYNNIVYNNDNSYSFAEAAITVGYGSPNTGIEVYNNTIVSNTFAGAYGISICGSFGTCSGVTVKNNILWQNGTDAVQIGSGASGSVVSNNLIATNPVFGNNFALQASSPALASNGFVGANKSSLFTTDIDGTLRQTGTNPWDAGARTVSGGGGGGGGTPPPPTPPAAPTNLRVVP